MSIFNEVGYRPTHFVEDILLIGVNAPTANPGGGRSNLECRQGYDIWIDFNPLES